MNCEIFGNWKFISIIQSSKDLKSAERQTISRSDSAQSVDSKLSVEHNHFMEPANEKL